MSVSLIAVFIPLLLMGGVIGRLFREFAVTLSVAIVVSLCVSLTTTPMMCARFLKSEKEIQHGKLYQACERVFMWSVETYASGLRWVLRHQPLMLVLTGGDNLFERLPVHHHSQGIFSAAGYRPDGRKHSRRAGHFFPRHAAETETIHRHRHERPRRQKSEC